MTKSTVSFDTGSLALDEGEDLSFHTFIIGFNSFTQTVGAIFVCKVRYDGDRLVCFRFSRDLGDINDNLCVEETVARRRTAVLLSGFGFGHVRRYAPFTLILIVLHFILREKSRHILVNVREWHFVQHSQEDFLIDVFIEFVCSTDEHPLSGVAFLLLCYSAGVVCFAHYIRLKAIFCLRPYF